MNEFQQITASSEELNRRGIALARQGRLDEAVASFQRAVQINPQDAAAHGNLGLALSMQGKLDEALVCCRRVVELRADSAEGYSNLGRLWMAQGRIEEALACLRRSLELKPGFAEAHNRLGLALQKQGKAEEAAASYRAALQSNPAFAEADVNLGNVLKEKGDLDEAIACYQRALQLKPDCAEAYNNLSFAFRERGKLDEAIAFCRRALELKPDFAEAHDNLGAAFGDQGKPDEALACHRRALELKPDFALAHSNLGNVLKDQGHIDRAVASYRRALELKPKDSGARINLAIALAEQEKLPEAKECYHELLRLRPPDLDRELLQLRMEVLCPGVFENVESIDAYRRGLLRLAENSPPLHLQPRLARLALSAAEPPFNLLYHGRDNRPLKEAYARIFREERPPDMHRAGAARPQIGLLVTPRHEGIFVRFWNGMLQRMKTDRFQLVILCAHAGAEGLRAAVGTDSVRLLPIPPRLDHAIQTIRAARLDVLYYWEVGSDATNYFLPFFRLAPVQCTSLALQDTSGIAQLDYYLSSSLIEPEDPQQHYTEKLLCAKTLLTYHPRQVLPETFKPREAFGLHPRQHVYLCAQNVRKFHPDFDPILAGILQRDAAGVIVIAEDKHGYLAEKLRRRFAATIPEAARRIVFLPRQKYADYLSLVWAADVLLDPLYYSGGTTSYEALSLGKPIVTWPWRLQIGRSVLAFYRKMGIAGCVAAGAEEYIKTAVSLGTDRDYRDAVGREIAAASGELFEDAGAVREHEEIFERLVEQARSG
jgi:tetratricopeptide (TPR) repeat protein/glycosyltransferase involved in cell wall biosynthesis